jgi:hypothetical protein
MGDLGHFEVQSAELRAESAEWTRRKTALADAKALADNGLAQGYNMGFFARMAGLDRYHDGFVSDMVQALADGERTFDFIAAALDSTANAYDGADDTSAESAAALRRRLPL